jgi:hypothetical protein
MGALTGCYAAIPPPIDPAMLPACSAGNYGVLGRDRCERDSDCHACDLGSSCVASVDASCAVGTCDVACCEGRCTVVGTESGLSEYP